MSSARAQQPPHLSRLGTAQPAPHLAARSARRPLTERVPLHSCGLLTADLLALAFAGAWSDLHPVLALAFSVTVVLFRASGRLYRPRLRLSALEDLPRSLMTVALASGVLAVLPSLVHVGFPAHARTRMVAGFLVLSEILRILVMAAARWARRHRMRGDRTLILGAGAVGRALAQAMLDFPELGLRPVGFVDRDPFVENEVDLPVPVLSDDSNDLVTLIERHHIGTVVVSFALSREADLVDTAITAGLMGRTVFVVPRLFEMHRDGPDVERLRGYPLVRLHHDPTARPTWWVKRTCDIVVATALLVALSPVLLVCALAVRLDGGPILFSQDRIGLGGHRFRILKLRSMTPENELESQSRWTIAADPRLTRIGTFLRRTSLDELPQLWNIVRGQMSFVGPRPERPTFVQQFSAEHERYWARHRVPSGLTGLAQVNGLRGDTSIQDRARYDNYYIANWSLWLDLQIVLLTIREVLRGSGR